MEQDTSEQSSVNPASTDTLHLPAYIQSTPTSQNQASYWPSPTYPRHDQQYSVSSPINNQVTQSPWLAHYHALTPQQQAMYHMGSMQPIPFPTMSNSVPATPVPQNQQNEATNRATVTEEEPPPQPQKDGQQKKGKGSKSGVNARPSGHSDTEIEKLDEKTKQAADISAPSKRMRWDAQNTAKLVDFIVAPERWSMVSTSITKICTEASQTIFDNKISSKQCLNRWGFIFGLYKATKKRMNHTGGGDGDEGLEGLMGADGAEIVQEYMDNEISDDEEKDGGKNKKGKNTNQQGSSRHTKYGVIAMDRFAESDLYTKILKVAEGRADIDRTVEYSSHRKPEEINRDVEKAEQKKKRKKIDEEETDELLKDAIVVLKNRQARTDQRDEERLAFDKKSSETTGKLQEEKLQLQRTRDELAAAQAAQMMKIELARFERETQDAELRQKHEREEARHTKLTRYRQYRDSEDPLEQAMAKKLAEEIRAEEGL